MLDILAKSYVCNDCGKSFTEETPLVEPGKRITNRLRNELGRLALNMTFDQLAENYNISHTTIGQAFREWAAEQDKEHDKGLFAPRILGIDEAHLCVEGTAKRSDKSGDPDVTDSMRGVFIDSENGTLIDITKNRRKETVIDWLRNLQDKERLEAVTIDMWQAYRDAVKEVFKDDVIVVIDHFHVIQALMEAFMKVKGTMQAGLEPGTLKAFTNYQSCLQADIEDLGDEDKELLARLFAAVPGIDMVYGLKESFRSIYRCRTRADAEKAFETWASLIPADKAYDPYRKIVKMVRHWHKEIFNYFDLNCSNASTEAINGIIKIVNRQGHGYSYPVLRAKMLYGAGRRAYTGVKKIKTVTVIDSDNTDIYTTRWITPGSFTHTHTEEREYTANVFGVNLNWLADEVKSGRFFEDGRQDINRQ